MEYERLLTAAGELGYRLAMCGAEIYRVEESIQRLLAAYGVQGEVFAIPNCVILSLTTAEGRTVTQLRRITPHGTDIYLLEAYNDLCRRLCREHPPLEELERSIAEVKKTGKSYSFPTELFAHFLGAGMFSLFFGGAPIDLLWGGVCGVVVCLSMRFMTRLLTNQFFKTMASGAISAMVAQILAHLGLVGNLDAVIIGALMILVPGIAFTTAVRDIMAGDMIAGISRVGESVLLAVAIAIGTGLALGLSGILWGCEDMQELIQWLLPVYAFIACLGFAVMFNIHSMGILICALGGSLGWLVFLAAGLAFHDPVLQSLIAGVAVSLYSEIMARVRHCPVTAYLIVSLFPMVPGGGIYYTMVYALRGETELFYAKGMETLGIAGALSVGVLLVASVARLFFASRHHRLHR